MARASSCSNVPALAVSSLGKGKLRTDPPGRRGTLGVPSPHTVNPSSRLLSCYLLGTVSEVAYILFDTAIGTCAVAWGARGIRSSRLPERTRAATRLELERRFPGACEGEPPAEVHEAMRAIVDLLDGKKRDLTRLRLDMDGISAFARTVYQAARTIPPGETSSYGELADRIGRSGAARAVGHALGRNPFAIVVPCHRVLARGGELVGFSAAGGVHTKARLLQIEGVVL